LRPALVPLHLQLEPSNDLRDPEEQAGLPHRSDGNVSQTAAQLLRFCLLPADLQDPALMSLGPPRLLVEPSVYLLRNLGDMAMLRSAIERLGTVLPGATIQVLTDEPNALHSFCPAAIPLDGSSRHLTVDRQFLDSNLRKILPKRHARRVRRRIPDIVANAIERHLGRRSSYMKALRQADLLVVAGMGGVTDSFPEFATRLLRSIELALELDCPVTMVGQGIGPLEKPELRALAGGVLPRVDLIALREGCAGVPLLHALGVEPDRIVVTGDDALELAYGLRGPELGPGIGLNLRLAEYSAVEDEAAVNVGEAARRLASVRGSPLVFLPIARSPWEDDLEALRMMLPDMEQHLEAAAGISSPEDLIRQVQRCRLVITGSYHAGVFALANGIPAIGIAASDYYVDKFRGLADMFGGGCEIVKLDQPDYVDQLCSAVDELWDTAEVMRPRLLAAAQKQIASNQAAYQKIAKLVTDNRESRSRDAPLS
jgi:polysaccharide pyruvyl transferase WcaK-like protein